MLEYELQEDLNSVSKWLNNNELTINITKIKSSMLCTHSRKVDNINLKMNDQTLDIVDSYKYLGLILDSRLSFQKHIYHISVNVNYKLRKLKEIRHYINNPTAVTIFKSLIKPHLDYCDIIWDAAWPSGEINLQSIQEKALSIAYQGENDINKINKVTKTLPVRIRTEMHLAQHMYNIIKLPSPSFLTTTIEYASHSYETRTREQKNLKLKKLRTESLLKTVYYRAGLARNTVPGELRLCTSKLQFKKKVKDFYVKRLT